MVSRKRFWLESLHSQLANSEIFARQWKTKRQLIAASSIRIFWRPFSIKITKSSFELIRLFDYSIILHRYNKILTIRKNRKITKNEQSILPLSTKHRGLPASCTMWFAVPRSNRCGKTLGATWAELAARSRGSPRFHLDLETFRSQPTNRLLRERLK